MNAPADAGDFFYTSRDGLRLHAADRGDRLSQWLPVVCLPGLTRTTRDFATLAERLATHRQRPRRVVAFDYRGRGQSQWDHDGSGYTLLAETNDILDGMAAMGIGRAIVVGTSRGGIIGMLMAIMRPATVAALVLNDVGPELDPRGLARIKTYVGQMPAPDTWADAVAIQRRLHGGQFTDLSEAEWEAFARLTYADDSGVPRADYDANGIAATFAGVEPDQPAATLWKEFAALGPLPMQVIHGANSDLLTPGIVKRMREACPHLDVVEVAGEGHPPQLAGAATLGKLTAFIFAVEGNAPAPETVVPRVAPPYSLDD